MSQNQQRGGRQMSLDSEASDSVQTGSKGGSLVNIFWPLWILGSVVWWWLVDSRWGASLDLFSYLGYGAAGTAGVLFVSLILALLIDVAFAGGRRSKTNEGSSDHGTVVEDQTRLQADLKIAAELRRQLMRFRLASIGIGLALAAFCTLVLPALFGESTIVQIPTAIAGAFFALTGLLAARSLHMAAPNEVAVVFLLGRFRKQGRHLYGVRGLRKILRTDGQGYEYDTGGFFWTIPFFETITMVSLRIHHDHFKSSLTQTRDQVAVNVEVVYYVRRSPERPELSVIAVEGSDMDATHQAAQIASRDMLGKSTLAQVSSDLRTVADAARETLEKLVVHWGHDIVSLGMTDLNIVSEKVRDALSDAAEAGITREARVQISEAEKKVANNLDEASVIYQRNPQAFLLRYFQVISDATKEGKSTVVLPGNLEGLLGGLFKGLDYPTRLSPREDDQAE